MNDQLRRLFQSNQINKIMYDKLRVTHSVAPQLYGLPKIHKDNTLMRPIVSCIGTPTYNLAKTLAGIISPPAGRTFSYVRDSGDFIQKTKTIHMGDNDVLISFDVKSLFTKVPIDEALDVIGDRLETCDDPPDTPLLIPMIQQLLRLCLTSTYFMWYEEFYEQTDGAAMGNPLSPIVANIYMEFFEKLALDTAAVKPKLWLRYVDDTFVIWEGSRDELDAFLHHLNSIRSSIQFTMETEEKSQLPFLDVMVKREEQHLTTTVYRKKTHTDHYVHFTSNHHPKVKHGVINCLMKRAQRICGDKEEMRKETKHLEEAFRKNGYPLTVIQREIERATRPRGDSTDDEQEKDERPLCVLPYVRGLSEKLADTCRKRGVKAVFKTRNTLRHQLTRVKGKHKNAEKGIVYQIPCKDCSLSYIGETGRPLNVRIKEHQRAVRNGDMKNAIAVLSEKETHRIDWDNAKILEKEQNWKRRKLKESLHIRRHHNFNLDQGFSLSHVWDPLIGQSSPMVTD